EAAGDGLVVVNRHGASVRAAGRSGRGHRAGWGLQATVSRLQAPPQALPERLSTSLVKSSLTVEGARCTLRFDAMASDPEAQSSRTPCPNLVRCCWLPSCSRRSCHSRPAPSRLNWVPPRKPARLRVVPERSRISAV